MTNSGIILVASAALFWGLSGGIAGILINNDWDALLISFYRGAIGLVFVLIWLALRPRYSGLANSRLWLWAVIAGLGVAGNFGFYFFSISESNVAVAATLMYCAPIFVYLISFALKLESPTLVKWAAIALVMVGVVLLTRVYQMEGNSITLLGVATGLLSGLSLALFIFGFKYATQHGSPQAILSIAFLTLVVVLGVLIDPAEAAQVPGSVDWPLFAIIGVLGGGASFILYLIGLRRTPPALASIVATIEPVTASLFGVIVLGEILAYSQVLGMLLILVTVTALGVYSGKESSD
ncbi:MAG TPA: EamA family transporter [Idiomarina abyssalis]|mgnify:CR=1 FL=1|jgi:drug/metabolite transporter (DMT)-like permease|uniref:DMT family transporter n=1 Tax=Idiomarina abyssalis TaxID=86102 RepID=A0A8I1G9C8_9GAMM|nr:MULTISPECIES: DMT family transporter [Idiomarina]MBH95190.1 EamA family transporter [Idiomarina sp.]MBJ7267276.1 DMT family transporter [Idiomarina abyssalis]MBJ7273616.1 DMT family transporter [Idiomarina abyssalis]MBJ7315554.1 DMT family transporter [Idiomarina abyssalis]MDA6066138.1 DMT family transporter [Idiomarina abyssalis]|tara:strand:- start:80515 stop:81396 length:882 start_codon:yes stop_codon:yes gene_type:complete